MSASRKDYQAIAAALHEARVEAAWLLGTDGVTAVDTVTDHLATALAAGNPRFDAARFKEAAR